LVSRSLPEVWRATSHWKTACIAQPAIITILEEIRRFIPAPRKQDRYPRPISREREHITKKRAHKNEARQFQIEPLLFKQNQTRKKKNETAEAESATAIVARTNDLLNDEGHDRRCRPGSGVLLLLRQRPGRCLCASSVVGVIDDSICLRSCRRDWN